MNIINIKHFTTAVLVLMLGLGQNALSDDGVREVGHITWDKTGDFFVPADPSMMPANKGNVVFIRPADGDPLDTSANIGVNGDFQVSLQPGQYSQVLYCNGTQNVSIAPTGLKSNNLDYYNKQQINITPQANNYFLVDVDDATLRTEISYIDEQTALSILETQPEQTHQISRVGEFCEAPEVVEDEPYYLNVLFEFDKAVIQPIYNERIEKLADYLAEYPDAQAIIEGHTDSVGTENYNQGLSERRAQAVTTELINNYGVSASRLTSVGYGELRPEATNSTSYGRQQNRRVVAVVSSQ